LNERGSGQPSPADKRGRRQSRWNFGGSARIKDVAARQTFPDARLAHLPPIHVRGSGSRWVRAPGRRGEWSPEEIACVLTDCRVEFMARLGRRRDGAGAPAAVRQEVIDEAISLVVMSRKPIRSEQHLEATFWATVRLLLIEHRAGRHSVRVGSRKRIDLEHVTSALSTGDTPSGIVEARERVAQAADFMTQLDQLEQQVISLMAIDGIGVKLAARRLRVPAKTVIAAVRSADQKLERVAAIASAGRMCQYRRPALLAQARGDASDQHAQKAKAHLAACGSCRVEFSELVREMRGRDYQRRASSAFLPPLPIAAHYGLADRFIGFVSHIRWPTSGSSDRAAGLLGGGGVALKAAAVGTAVIATSAGVIGLTQYKPGHVNRQMPIRAHQRAIIASPSVLPTRRSAAIPRSRPISLPRKRTDHGIRSAIHFDGVQPEKHASVTNFPALGGNSPARPQIEKHLKTQATTPAERVLQTP
jgi:DNA-directed RNA polymerase specialized sigma24 family protein